jgi:hypothetical protein
MDSDPPARVFHVELKQFPGNARRFNLSRQQLDAEFLVPWLAGDPIKLEDRNYLPEKAKLKILAGPRLRQDEIGMGRGWANAERAGEDITERLLAEVKAVAAPSAQDALVEDFKAAVVIACSDRRLPLREVAAMSGARHQGARVSEQLALAERAVWELLHQRRILLFLAGEASAVPRERWEPVVLAWASWSGDEAPAAEIEALPGLGDH